MIRQCSDINELRACRQLITQEMNMKHKNPIYHSYIADLRQIQYLIDRRSSILQGATSSEIDHHRFRDNTLPRTTNMPILTLDEILNRELAKSYYLDYLSSINLQRYVLFYITAQEWKCLLSGSITRNEARENAIAIYSEYLDPLTPNHLLVDGGLTSTLRLKLFNNDYAPESQWFESTSKYVYEKIKNEDIFLNNFYQSNLYKKLLRELDYDHSGSNSDVDIEINSDIGSDSGSNIILIDDDHSTKEEDLDDDEDCAIKSNLLDTFSPKHARSQSDCTGINRNMQESPIPNKRHIESEVKGIDQYDTVDAKAPHDVPPKEYTSVEPKQKVFAKIKNAAIRNDGQYAVYSIEVVISGEIEEKSWHIYRRYSRFLDLKKALVKKFPELTRLPFPSKKVFQNTQRALLEERMKILNLFLHEVCIRAENNDEIYSTICEFLEPDNDDWRIHGGAVTRTLETIVNPFKSGIRTIRNMPDNFVSGLSKIFLGRSVIKDPTNLLQVPSSIPLDQKSSEYPALTSALQLLDEVFDLQSRSQWLRRGIINRLLGKFIIIFIL